MVREFGPELEDPPVVEFGEFSATPAPDVVPC